MAGNGIPKRRLGTTGDEVSILGVGGSHIGLPSVSENDAIRIVRAAIDNGVTFMDNNWGYNDGLSEERMGKALQNGYRDRAFLMTKVDARTRGDALQQLDESLKRLRTDHLDLWQIHEVVYPTDPERASMPGGVLEALDEARRTGKARWVGFTGHKDPAIHLAMLDQYPFDTVQMPLNVMDTHFRSFEQLVLPELLARHLGVIAMKSLGDGQVLKSKCVSAEEAISFTLSLPITTLVLGMERMADLEAALDVARGFVPLAEHDVAAIRAKTAPIEISGDGRFELYKTSIQFDADFGRAEHGFPLHEAVVR